MYKVVRQDEKGAVAMITVIFVAIILTIITASFIRLAVNEQREATDDDLTTRAFYAAEAGVQDAITAIKSGAPLVNPDNCTPESGVGGGVLSTNLDTEYTCQTIDLTPTSYQTELAENESVFFILDSGTDNISSFTVYWNQQGIGPDDVDSVVRPSADNDLPPRGEWSDGTKTYPAMIRLQVLEIPDTVAGGIKRTDIDNGNKVSFLNPTNGTGSRGIGSINGGLVNAKCSITSESDIYSCSMEVTGLRDSNHAYYLRLRSLYKATNVKVVAKTAAGIVTALINAQAVIDVTARAGDVYRRVQDTVSLTPDGLWPDFAILSAEDICKNFVITDIPGDYSNVNNLIAGAPQSCSY